MEAEGGARDDAESAECAGDKFGKIVACDVFHNLAAAAGKRAVGKSDGDADNEVAKRAKSKTKSAAVIRGEHAADGGLFWPESIERQALAVLRESLLQFLDGAAGFDSEGEVGPSMLDDFVEASGGQNQIGARRGIAPGELGAAAARNDSETSLIRKTQDFGECRFAGRFDDKLGLNSSDSIGGGRCPEIARADKSDEFVAEGGREGFRGGIHGSVEILRAAKGAALRMTNVSRACLRPAIVSRACSKPVSGFLAQKLRSFGPIASALRMTNRFAPRVGMTSHLAQQQTESDSRAAALQTDRPIRRR